MARLDVRRLKGVKGVALIVEMQSELLADIRTVVVVPLVPPKQLPAMDEINPVFDIHGQEFALRAEQIVSVPRSRLGETVGSLAREEYRVLRALDRLLSRT